MSTQHLDNDESRRQSTALQTQELPRRRSHPPHSPNLHPQPGSTPPSVVSKTRGDAVDAANADFFHPRRLDVKLCTFEAFKEISGIPKDADVTAPLGVESIGMSVLERKMAALQPYLSPLTMDVLPPTPQTGMLPKMYERQVIRDQERIDRVSMKARLKGLEKSELSSEESDQVMEIVRASGDEKMITEAEKLRKVLMKNQKNQEMNSRKTDKREAKVHRAAEKDMAKAESEGKMEKITDLEEEKGKQLAKLQESVSKKEEKRERKSSKEDKEIKSAQKGKWAVIQPWNEPNR